MIFLLMAVSLMHAADVTRAQYLMGTICEIEAIGLPQDNAQQAVSAAFEEMARLEEILSTYRDTSEVMQLIKDGAEIAKTVSPDLFTLLERSSVFSEKTDGTFDVTLKNRGYRQMKLNRDKQTVLFKEKGLTLDFGGIAKGYALDRAAEILKKYGVTESRINFSGNILVIGNGSRFREVRLSDPGDASKHVLRLVISNASVSTSSQLERRNHIVDPRTGRSVDFQGSVTVIAPTAIEADALSTALLVLGPEKGIPLVESRFSDAAVLFLIPSEHGWVHVASSNFSKYLSS